MAAAQGLSRVYIHAFMDGRDTPPTSGASHLAMLQTQLGIVGTGQVASICGRFYAMDRDNRWERVERAWHAMVDGVADHSATDPVTAVQEAYRRGETDEFITPILMTGPAGPAATIQDRDTVLFFNFRADRTRQTVHAFIDPAFDRFPLRRRPQLASCVTFTQYDKQFDLPVAFPPVPLTHILGEEVSLHHMRQLRIAETEKYAHVTYFFNGGREEPMPGEERILIPSPQEVPTYDFKPEMSAVLVTDELLRRLDVEHYDLVVLNFANGDMVGHTGVMAAAVRACETVDACVGRLVARFTRDGGIVLITADHGNAEIMVDPQDGGPFTAHSRNPVPFILVSDHHRSRALMSGGALKDIAPTILALLGLPQPVEMEGKNLIL
jgi:2,3-bisphosphoglycerate-independent phosphoglycerate mutase